MCAGKCGRQRGFGGDEIEYEGGSPQDSHQIERDYPSTSKTPCMEG